MRLSKPFLANLCFLTGAHAFWRMVCHGQTGLARIDPIMSPGAASQHAHSIFGSSGMSFDAGFEELNAGKCTSCQVSQDKSAYWHPQLYFQYPNGTLEAVPQEGGMLAYYFLNNDSVPDPKIVAFPEGFRMIAGDSTRRNCTINGQPCPFPDPDKSSWAPNGETSQGDLQQRAIGFNCLHYNTNPEGTLYRHFMPTKDFLDQTCTTGLRMELMFPSCWNGQDIDSHDHKSHVVYPDLVMTGSCPEGFKVKLPSLMYETIYNTYLYNTTEGQFVFSNGDPTGFGYHGDFMMGWPSVDFLQNAVNTCTNLSGEIEDCPLFNIQGDKPCSLDVPPAIADEPVSRGLPQLPGRVAIQSGPQPATFSSAAPALTSAATFAISATPQSSNKILAASIETSQASSGVIIPNASSAPMASSSSLVAAPPAASITPSPSETYIPVRTEYVTSGSMVEEIVFVAPVDYITADIEVTTTQPAKQVAARKRRHMHQHAHHLGHAHH